MNLLAHRDPGVSRRAGLGVGGGGGGDRLIGCAAAIAVGVASGLACVSVRLFYRLLQWIFVGSAGMLSQAAAGLSPERRVLTPMLGAGCATLVLWAVRRWGGGGPFVEYVEAVRFEEGRIPFRSTLWRTLSSAFSVATGAAIGREGSMIQFATAVSSWVGERAPLGRVPLARMVAYGAAAAVAAAYQAPLAAVFFATEIVLGRWDWEELPPLLLASTAGWLVSCGLLGGGPLFAAGAGQLLSWQALWALPLALLLGALGPVYQALLRSLRFAGRWPLALLWGGLVVGGLSLLQTEVWGNGDAALLHLLHGSPALSGVVVVLVLRLVATSFCVGTGTVGGVFTPTVFVGGALGLAAGHLLQMGHPVVLAIVGMSALLGAVTRAPLMAALMAVELTGRWELLVVLLPLNLIADRLAQRISPHSLYAIATPTPMEELAVS
jgi:CIC family chloride channel protein